jgi:3-phenylpropionate/cinnamic acid dioxygenase small subunit
MTPVEKLTAKAEIAELLVSYCLCFDDQNWDEFAGLWADDAVFAVEDHEFRGKQAVLDFLTTCLPPGYTSKHMLSQPLIRLSDDGMSATAQTDVVWIAANFENAIVGRYNDQLSRVEGRWKFRYRSETPVPYRAGPTPMSDTAQSVSGDTMNITVLNTEQNH